MRAPTVIAVVGLTVTALFSAAGAAVANSHDAPSAGNGVHRPGVDPGNHAQDPWEAPDSSAGNAGTANDGLNQTFGENGSSG